MGFNSIILVHTFLCLFFPLSHHGRFLDFSFRQLRWKETTEKGKGLFFLKILAGEGGGKTEKCMGESGSAPLPHALAEPGGRLRRDREAHVGPLPACFPLLLGVITMGTDIREHVLQGRAGLLLRYCWGGPCRETQRGRGEEDARRDKECGQDVRADKWVVPKPREREMTDG